jgi:hypothetical protein
MALKASAFRRAGAVSATTMRPARLAHPQHFFQRRPRLRQVVKLKARRDDGKLAIAVG